MNWRVKPSSYKPEKWTWRFSNWPELSSTAGQSWTDKTMNYLIQKTFFPVNFVAFAFTHPTLLLWVTVFTGFGHLMQIQDWLHALQGPGKMKMWGPLFLKIIGNFRMMTVEFYFSLLFFSCFLRALPAAYGSSQARGWIRTVAASLQHSHRNVGSELYLWLVSLAAVPDP